MLKPLFIILFLFSNCYFLSSQTTDLSIGIEAQDLSGNTISQINIYEDFQYVITVSNSGNSVENSTIAITFDTDLFILSTTSQNNNAGASDITNIILNDAVLAASIAILPNNSSVELLVLVTAPTDLGGIAANGIVSPPTGTTDTNTSNNQSIISIDVLDFEINFSVTHTQIQPTEGTAISAWGDNVTYQFTITNNSTIDFPVSITQGILSMDSVIDLGQPIAQFISLECIATTNGTVCPELDNINPNAAEIQTSHTLFSVNDLIEITSGGSITFEMVYKFSNFSCSPDPIPIDVKSNIRIVLSQSNSASNISNSVITKLLSANLCDETDICIETEIVNPSSPALLNYDENITLTTTVCNNGPLEAPIRFFLQNLNIGTFLEWEILSANCVNTTGAVTCSDFILSINDQSWASNDFVLQPYTTITIETILKYSEPCGDEPIMAIIRSGTNILDSQLFDSNISNNFFGLPVTLPIPSEPCGTSEMTDLQVTKIQVSPELPSGSNEQNPAEWGLVTYEIEVTNVSEVDAIIKLQDYMPVPNSNDAPLFASLVSVECIATTGTASCFDIQNANIGVQLDGITQDGLFDTFWEILPEENRSLPANSSVRFNATIDWQPECSIDAIIGTNIVSVDYVNNTDTNTSNNKAEVRTFFAPCVDLIVQTYPESTQVNTNETFNWIVDISNSVTSSNAINILFEDTINTVFNIVGSPTCSVTSGNTTCISNFNINGNFISGIIPTMEAGSTVRITIPVTAPSFGGAFNNIAEAIPSAANNEEITPETNISINSVQVIAPLLEKSFTPDTIIESGQSELSFTIFNIASNPTQSNISFIDNLPTGVTLSGLPNWISANGCAATFSGNIGDGFVGVENLVFPAGVESCTFSVMVTSDTVGTYLNNFENFSNANAIDTSQASATLNVIIDTSDIDIEILKSVTPTEAAYGQNVEFSITTSNLGTTTATAIEITDQLPQGYNYISSIASAGAFNDNTLIWSIPSLDPSVSEELILTVQIISANDLTNVAILNSVNEPDRNLTNNEDDATVEISNCLTIHEGISPNDDRKNDTLIIPCIEDYPENVLKIYNRYGTQIYEASSYLNTWSGKANMGILNSSELLPVGTYFYVLDINEFEKPFVGYVYLNY